MQMAAQTRKAGATDFRDDIFTSICSTTAGFLEQTGWRAGSAANILQMRKVFMH
jgi:hypothetical protein